MPARSLPAKLLALLLVSLVLVPLVAREAHAAPGDRDASFGSGGVTTTPIGSFDDGVSDVALQANGAIVVAGSTETGTPGPGTLTTDFALARYTSNGQLDTSFNGSGKVTTGIGQVLSGPGDDAASAVAIQPDGKIVAAGWAEMRFGYDFAVTRYAVDGSLDPAWGSGGKVTTDIAGNQDDFGNAMMLQPDGKIVVAGTTGNDFALIRYGSTGTLDGTFGSGGKVITDMGSDFDEIHAIALQSDGKIVAAGTTVVGPGFDFAVVRYTSSGALDPTFGTGGKVTTDIAGQLDHPYAIVVQADGRIIAAGEGGVAGQYRFALVRYLASGALDSSFGSGGKVTIDIEPNDDSAGSVVLPPDGKIIVAGASYNAVNAGPDSVVEMARLEPNGSLDPAFGTGGLVTDSWGPGSDFAAAAVLQSDGRIVIGGGTYNGSNTDFAVARYLAGPPDTSIQTGPAEGSSSSSTSATFTYQGIPATDTDHFECSLDGGSFALCPNSSVTYSGLEDGSHTFLVRAVDAAGNADPSPASRGWSVDATPPDTILDSGPDGGDTGSIGGVSITNEPSPSFTFHASEVATFQCTVDSAPYSSCQSGDSFGPLTNGIHSFAVRAVDGVANADPSPAQTTFKVYRCTISGTDANDILVGTTRSDVICGGRGGDQISSDGGADVIFGSWGKDTITGGSGNDQIIGGPADDSLNGNSGNDAIDGGPGDDTLNGGLNSDTCSGDTGIDTARSCEHQSGIP